MQKQEKKFFRGSLEDFLDKNAIWDRTPPTYTSIVWGRVQWSQIFKRNSIISIHSKVMAFLVISLFPWSPRCPRHPHVIPVIPTSSLCCSCHPHIFPIAPRRSPCGSHGCGLCCLCGLHPMLSPWSPWSPHHPCCLHIVPVVPMSSPCHPHHLHIVPKAPRRSPCGPHGCGLHGLRCLHGLHPMLSRWSPLSLLSPCHSHCPHIVPTLSRRSLHHS